MGRDLPPSTAATLLLGKALVGVGIVYGAVLVALPLEGPEWPRLAMGAAVAVWGVLAWWRAAGGHVEAPFMAAAGLSATSWSYYLVAPELGTQVTGTALLLPILACLPILGPRGVALVGLGSIAVDLVSRGVHGVGPDAPPVLAASLVVATAVGWVVARLHEQYVLEVAAARAHERELAVLRDVEAKRAAFLRRFINAVSHEIATPLTPIVIGLAGDAPPSPQTMARVRRNVERLDHIARGLGTVAAVEERAPDDPVPLVLRPVVEPIATEAGWDVRGDGEALADAELVRTVLAELIQNQQRHAPEAQVQVRLAPGQMRVVQRPANLPPGTRLGRPFTRHHPSSRGGLGLYAATRRLERMGGGMDIRASGDLVHAIRFPHSAPVAAKEPRPQDAHA